MSLFPRRDRLGPISDHQRVEITTDLNRIDLDIVCGWLSKEAYWSRGIPRPVFDRAIEKSICFGALRESETVGFTRVVTDRASFAWLCDVFVAEEARGARVGKRLMDAAMAHPDLQGLRTFLLATSDAHGLYRQYGFQPLETPESFMAIRHRAEDLYGEQR